MSLPSDPGTTLRPHSILGGDLAPGTVIGDGASASVVIPCRGQLRARIRAKLSANDGTLSFAFLRPDADGDFAEGTVHASGNPEDLALPDTNEAATSFDYYGETYLKITYTDTAGGSTIDYVAVSQL